MQNDRIFKMSELADTVIKDVPTLNILICYLMKKIDKPINTEHLYDILIATGLANYFYYQDSIAFLLENGHIKKQTDEAGNESYILMPKGEICARELKKYAPKSYRDDLVLAALKYFARMKTEQEVSIAYTEADDGCYVNVVCKDVKNDLMELRLYAPDKKQARLIGENIMLNPAAIYSGIIELIMNNEEISYDLTDN